MEYRNLSGHAQEIEVGDTVPWVESGGIVDLSGDDLNSEHNTGLIESGVLVDLESLSPKEELPTITLPYIPTEDEEGGDS